MTTISDDSAKSLLRAYLEAVTLNEGLQTRLWQAAELTLGQVRALRRLAQEPKSLGQLGQELGLAPPSVTRLIDRLEERGLLERSRTGDDRRKVLAALTPKGRRIVSKVLPMPESNAIRAAAEQMSPADQSRIASAFRDFSAAVRRAEEALQLVEAQT
jgi:DNA-binding MarR family transcriptional regulator